MISLFKPYFGEEELDALRPIFASGWIGMGPRTEAFENAFASFVGATHCVGLNSCTAALDLALRLLGVNAGDEVIVPTVTFVSTAHAVRYNLATPIFADVDHETLNVDPADIARKITPRTKAVMVVHYGGRPVDLDGVREVIGDIPLVEDCAHASGGYYRNRHVGTFGAIGCYSFHAVKNLAMGDGGAITVHDDWWAHRARRLRWLGIDKSTWDRSSIEKRYWWEYLVEEIGFKCHMNDIQAAIGLVQLAKLDAMNGRRREIAHLYDRELADIPQLTLPLRDDDTYRSSWHIYHVKAQRRDSLSEYLADKGISTGVHYKPIHLYACYGNRPVLPVSEKAFESILSLPMHPGLSDDDVARVCETIREFYRQ